MKILFDECVPVQIRNALPEHEIHSATDPKWRGLSNGELLHLVGVPDLREATRGASSSLFYSCRLAFSCRSWRVGNQPLFVLC
jgi:hypothetical protein